MDGFVVVWVVGVGIGTVNVEEDVGNVFVVLVLFRVKEEKEEDD